LDETNRSVASGSGSQEELTARRSKFEQTRATLEQVKGQLEAIKAIRKVDVQAAEAEVAQAEASLTVAREDLRSTEVRSPLSGRVLCIRTRPGERVGDQGILDVGNTNAMQVVAEVYEEDVGKVSISQQPRSESRRWGLELSGVVVGKDLIVRRKVIFSNDPVADIDAPRRRGPYPLVRRGGCEGRRTFPRAGGRCHRRERG